MNGYKVFSFHTKEGIRFIVVDSIVPDVNNKTVFFQAFVLNGDSYPFSLIFEDDLHYEKLMETAFEDASNYVKEIEQWSGEKTEIQLKNLMQNSHFLRFIKDNCKSTKLSEDIEIIFKQLALE